MSHSFTCICGKPKCGLPATVFIEVCKNYKVSPEEATNDDFDVWACCDEHYRGVFGTRRIMTYEEFITRSVISE